MSEETKEEVTTEEVTRAKTVIETIIDENRATTDEDLLKLTCGKEAIQTAIADFTAFKKRYKLPSIKAKYYVIEDEAWEIKTPDVLSDSIDELRIYTRQYAIAKEKRLLYIIRQEELISLVNEIQGKLEEYDEFVKSVNNDRHKIDDKYPNSKLQEFAMYKSQTIPMYMVELETLASSIKDNEETYIDSGIKVNEITSGIIRYLKEEALK